MGQLQALHTAKNGSPHAAQLLLWGFNLLDPTRSQTAMWRVQQGLLSGKPVPKKSTAEKNRAKASRYDVWQLWQRKAAKFVDDVAGISSGSSSSKTIRSMFSSSHRLLPILSPLLSVRRRCCKIKRETIIPRMQPRPLLRRQQLR